jgi:1-acyl-sn-glycerol-3-phosphate acyltransferase
VLHLKTYNAEILPSTGPLILASNHASHLDAPCVSVAVPYRDIHFMARSTLFKPRLFGWLIRNVNAHPIIRGQGPNQDWDSFVHVLTAGGVLLVFPEGTRSLDGELQRGKSGFGKLAYMSRVPVYPVYVRGSYQAWPKGGKLRPRPVSVHFGWPVALNDLLDQPEEKRVLRDISDRVMQAIAELKKEAEKEKP